MLVRVPFVLFTRFWFLPIALQTETLIVKTGLDDFGARMQKTQMTPSTTFVSDADGKRQGGQPKLRSLLLERADSSFETYKPGLHV